MYYKYAALSITRTNATKDRRYIFSLTTPHTQLFDLPTNKTREVSIKTTFKNNTFTRQRTLIIPEYNPLEKLHQLHHRNQLLILTLSLFLQSVSLKPCRLACRELIKLNQLIGPPQNHHTSCYNTL